METVHRLEEKLKVMMSKNTRASNPTRSIVESREVTHADSVGPSVKRAKQPHLATQFLESRPEPKLAPLPHTNSLLKPPKGDDPLKSAQETIAQLELTTELRAKEAAEMRLKNDDLCRENARLKSAAAAQEARLTDLHTRLQSQQAEFEQRLTDNLKSYTAHAHSATEKDAQIDKITEKYLKKKAKIKLLKTSQKMLAAEAAALKDQADMLKSQLVEANRRQLSGLEELQAGCSEAGALKARV